MHLKIVFLVSLILCALVQSAPQNKGKYTNDTSVVFAEIGVRYEGTVLHTIANVNSATQCLLKCQRYGVYGAGLSYDKSSKNCIIFSVITGRLRQQADWVSSPCRRSGEDSCISSATSIAITHCGDDCEASEDACGTCITDKLEGNCSNTVELFKPWECVVDIPKCLVECASKIGEPWSALMCVKDCVPGECESYVCDALGEWPTVKQACLCLPTLAPIYEKCRKDNRKSWPNTIECIIDQLLDSPCVKVLCDFLKYAVPGEPEAVQICNCAVPIITSVQKCHDQYGSDWVRVAECVAKVVGKDCEKYLCKYAGKIFPPILQVPFCKNKARLH